MSHFLELFQPHSDDLHKFLLRKLGCAATAADLVQETWLRIVKLDPHRPIDNPRALLFRIAINLVTDHYRRSSKEAQVFIEDALTEDVVDRTPSIEEEILSKQQLRTLEAAIEELPTKRRAIFLMLKCERMTYAQVARALGISESTVMTQLVKAMAFCKKRVQDSTDE